MDSNVPVVHCKTLWVCSFALFFMVDMFRHAVYKVKHFHININIGALFFKGPMHNTAFSKLIEF